MLLGRRSQAVRAGVDALARSGSVLKGDLAYIQDHTGVDLLTPLGGVQDAHAEVVAALNPLAGGRMQRELGDQIAELQADLEQAQTEVSASEQRLATTISSLSALEDAAGSFAVCAVAERPAETASAPAPALEPALVQRARVALPDQKARRRRHLRSSLEPPARLREFWFPAAFSGALGAGAVVPFELFGEPWVLFRDAAGAPACVRDECAHRACPLSLGSIVDGHIQCPYHGWQYDARGECTAMPSTAFCAGVGVQSLAVVEADGLVWVWPGGAAAPTMPPPVTRPPPGFQVHAELLLEVPVEHGLLLENLLDLAHAPFTHTSTFAKGWPVPEVVRFNAARLLGGSWEPYPIDMSFEPPCMVLSTIGLEQPGKIKRGARAAACANHLHQLHVCLPAGPDRTRLLYRMSLDFLHWTRAVPGIQAFWRSIANQVMGEDLVLVAGQQDRMLRGGDVWKHPVAYDKLAVRYRRWRNSLDSADQYERDVATAALRQPMSAGELFALEADEDRGFMSELSEEEDD
ncbi:hypothetical protein WJX81_008409 [Elliptochloris bilobata]|uniref:Rieske domain-containing protein n=1 Tax=Elliptochloris bilobata TaxID=381761 RepID=A0AAW1QJP6_9CHLO